MVIQLEKQQESSKYFEAPNVLNGEEEEDILNQILVCADWGMSLDGIDIQLTVKKLFRFNWQEGY